MLADVVCPTALSSVQEAVARHLATFETMPVTHGAGRQAACAFITHHYKPVSLQFTFN